MRNRIGSERKIWLLREFAPLRQSATAAANAARSSLLAQPPLASLAACRLCNQALFAQSVARSGHGCSQLALVRVPQPHLAGKAGICELRKYLAERLGC